MLQKVGVEYQILNICFIAVVCMALYNYEHTMFSSLIINDDYDDDDDDNNNNNNNNNTKGNGNGAVIVSELLRVQLIHLTNVEHHLDQLN